MTTISFGWNILIQNSIFLFLQSESPADTLDALGIYLLVSLFYVAFTLIEFAIVLIIKRRHANSKESQNTSCKKIAVAAVSTEVEIKSPTQRSVKSCTFQRSSNLLQAYDPTMAIDKITCITFLCSYFIFNLVYVLIYLC